MKKLLLFSVLFLLFLPLNNASEDKTTNILQLPHIEWNITYGGNGTDFFYCGLQDKDGNYIAGGSRQIGAANYSWLMKVNENGKTIWNVYEMPNRSYMAFVSYVEEVGNSYIACGSHSHMISHLRYHRFLWKVSKDGKTEWIKEYNEPKEGHFYMVHAVKDGFIACGYVYINTNKDDTAALLMKTDENGNIEWQKLYNYGNGSEEAYCVGITSDGYILGGWAEVGIGNWDYWIIKVDKNGNMEWNRTYGGEKLDICHMRNCFETNDGYIFGGHTQSYGALPGYDIWVIKLNKNGNMLWNETYGYKMSAEIGWCINKAKNGYVIAGSKNFEGYGREGDAWIFKINENGNEMWELSFGGKKEDEAAYVCQTQDDGYIVIGRTKSFGHGGWDGWLVKLSPERRLPETKANFIKPRPNHIYLFNFGLPFPLMNKAIVIGNIDFMATASCDCNITRAEYFVDNKLVATVTDEPYVYEWNGQRGNHVIKVRAYNEWNGFGEEKIVIIKLY